MFHRGNAASNKRNIARQVHRLSDKTIRIIALRFHIHIPDSHVEWQSSKSTQKKENSKKDSFPLNYRACPATGEVLTFTPTRHLESPVTLTRINLDWWWWWGSTQVQDVLFLFYKSTMAGAVVPFKDGAIIQPTASTDSRYVTKQQKPGVTIFCTE